MVNQPGSAGIPSHFPVKQRIAMELKPKLKLLVNDFPYISSYFDDVDLKINMNDLLEKIGFVSDNIDVKEKDILIKRLLSGLEKNHLILIHYRQKSDDTNILNLFNNLKRRRSHK
jgi:hypothetical protein